MTIMLITAMAIMPLVSNPRVVAGTLIGGAGGLTVGAGGLTAGAGGLTTIISIT